MKSRLTRIFLMVAVLLSLALSYKVEKIQDVCSLTGTSRSSVTYFRVFTSGPEVKESWVEVVLRANGRQMPDYHWVRTSHYESTLISYSRGHASAPVTYHINSWNLELLREVHTDEEILKIADAFASGDRMRQQDAWDRLYDY